MKVFTAQQIIVKLTAEGLFFKNFSLINEGVYSAADADWNYKDVPHLHYVHELAESIIAVVGDDLVATINTQKVLGFKFPLALFNYQSGPNAQTYYTTWLFFALIIETRYEEMVPNRTRVTTTYHIGAPKWLSWCFPLIRWVLKKNYKNLMSTDIPMRERRGELRTWGYTFIKDKPFYSFQETMNIMRANVQAPDNVSVVENNAYDIHHILPADGEYFTGRSDHLGLRLIRKNDILLIYPRMCPHEGANLDQQKCDNKKIKCPWHGRVFNPVASFNLESQEIQQVHFGLLILKMQWGLLEISSAQRMI